MSQKMLAAVYGVDLHTVSYHITKIFKDAELNERKFWITATDGRYLLALEEETKRTQGGENASDDAKKKYID